MFLTAWRPVPFISGVTLIQTHTHKDLMNIRIINNVLEMKFTKYMCVWVWVSVAPLNLEGVTLANHLAANRKCKHPCRMQHISSHVSCHRSHIVHHIVLMSYASCILHHMQYHKPFVVTVVV